MNFSNDRFSTTTMIVGVPNDPASQKELRLYTYETGNAIYDVTHASSGALAYRTNGGPWSLSGSIHSIHAAIVQHFNLKPTIDIMEMNR